MLQKKKKTFFLNLTVKKVYSVIIQWHMFIFYFKLVYHPFQTINSEMLPKDN